MAELLTAEQMKLAERAAIDAGAATGLDLMERAGEGVVASVLNRWPDYRNATENANSAVVLCGPGNNGGDGFVIARLLKQAGWRVDVYLAGAKGTLPPDAKVNFQRYQEMGQIAPYDDATFQIGTSPTDLPVLLVDALFGTGLKRPVKGFDQAMLCSRKEHGPNIRVVAVDIPSGLDADSGKTLVGEDTQDAAFHADLTVTFHRAKLGHYLAEGPKHCGAVSVVDIGIDTDTPQT